MTTAHGTKVAKSQNLFPYWYDVPNPPAGTNLEGKTFGKKDGTKGEECLGVNTSGCFVRECKLDNNVFHCSELIFNHFTWINASYSPTYSEGTN